MADTTRIKMMVARDNQAHFVKYYDNQLWYRVSYTDGYGGAPYEDGRGNPPVEVFEFPVPISDIGNATFGAQEKAMLLMRYIRKHLDYIDKAKVEENVNVPNQ